MVEDNVLLKFKTQHCETTMDGKDAGDEFRESNVCSYDYYHYEALRQMQVTGNVEGAKASMISWRHDGRPSMANSEGRTWASLEMS